MYNRMQKKWNENSNINLIRVPERKSRGNEGNFQSTFSKTRCACLWNYLQTQWSRSLPWVLSLRELQHCGVPVLMFSILRLFVLFCVCLFICLFVTKLMWAQTYFSPSADSLPLCLVQWTIDILTDFKFCTYGWCWGSVARPWLQDSDLVGRSLSLAKGEFPS
jgi:hypothetical protein